MLLTGYIDNFVVWMMLAAVTFLVQVYRRQLWEGRGKGKGKGTRNDLHSIPGPLSLPFLGTTWIYIVKYKANKVHEAYKDMLHRYGGIVREVSAKGHTIVNISHRDDIEKVLRYPSRYPFRPPSKAIADYRNLHPDKFSSAGMANEQGELWHSLRTKLTPELSSKRTMLGFLPELNQIADDFVHLLRANRDSDDNLNTFNELSSRFGLEATCTLVLGQRMSYMDNVVSEPAIRLREAMVQRFQIERDEMFLWFDYTKTEGYLKFLKSEEELYSIISEIIEKARSSMGSIATDDVKSILNSIVERDDVDEKEKKSTLIDFVAAGVLTQNNSLNFLLYLVAKHPEVQQKVLEELEEIAPNYNHITGSDMARMVYTKACINESMRLIPVAFAIGRVLEEETVLSGYHLQPGTFVLSHTKVACSDEKNFTRAGEFLPERWLEGHPLYKESQAAATCIFCPFGIGKRMCPGKRFVEHQLVVVFAKMIREFHIEYDGELEVQFEFVLCPKTPVKLRLRDRC